MSKMLKICIVKVTLAKFTGFRNSRFSGFVHNFMLTLRFAVLYFKNTLVKTKEELEAEKQQKSAAPLPSALTQPTQQAPPPNNESNTKSKSKGKKNKRGFFDKFFGKSDSSSAPKDFQISSPSNFKHASHIGVDEKGEFQVRRYIP